MFWTRFYQPLTSRNALKKNTPLLRDIITRLAATFTTKEAETPSGPAKTRAKTTKKKLSELPKEYILPSGLPAAPLPDLSPNFITGTVVNFFAALNAYGNYRPFKNYQPHLEGCSQVPVKKRLSCPKRTRRCNPKRARR